MSLGSLGFGLKLMASSAKNMLFDCYQIKEGDTKYNALCKFMDYETFLNVMLEKSGNPERYRQIRNIAHSKKDSFTERDELLTYAESRFDEYIKKNQSKINTTNFKIYCAIALLECEKQAIQLINKSEEYLNSDDAAKLAEKTGYIYACFFMLSADKVQEKVKSKSQGDRAVEGGKKTQEKVLAEAILILESEDSTHYFWNTKDQEGELKKDYLCTNIGNRIKRGKTTVRRHLNELIKTNKLHPQNYYKKGQ